MVIRNDNYFTGDIEHRIKEVKKSYKLNEPPGPPFKPISKYIDDKIIYQLALLFTELLQTSIEKEGFVLEKNKKEELTGKFHTSLKSWGTESNYFFSHISSEEYVRKTFMKSIAIFGKRTEIISNLGTLISQVITKIDIPSVKEWVNNEYTPYLNYQSHKHAFESELSHLYFLRSLEHNKNISSSPISL